MKCPFPDRLSIAGAAAALIAEAALFAAAAAATPPPRVVADIAPVHSLVAMVMGDVATPVLLLPAGRSPHGYSLKPSQARALESADLVVRVGGSLTPWLSAALRSRDGEVADLTLLSVPGTTRLAFREGVAFDGSGHDHGHASEHAGEDAHQHHDDEVIDPHAWLDPRNASAWLTAIAGALSRAHPEGAEAYRRNAARARTDMDQLTREIDSAVAPLRGTRFLVYHDAFHYFEARFQLEAAGAVARGDAAGPGARRLRAVRSLARSGEATCLFSEPQLSSRSAATVSRGTALRRATLDPLGQGLDPGPALYPALMRRLTASFVGCLGHNE